MSAPLDYFKLMCELTRVKRDELDVPDLAYEEKRINEAVERDRELSVEPEDFDDER